MIMDKSSNNYSRNHFKEHGIRKEFYYFELANLKKQFCSLKEMVLDIVLKVNHTLKHLHKHPQHPHIWRQ